MSGERRALTLISLGIAETWTSPSDQAERHLQQGVALARQIGRPYLELLGLAHAAQIAVVRSLVLGAQQGLQAIELAGRHGWGEEPITGVAYIQLAGVTLAQGRLEEAERWLDRTARVLRAELEPLAGMNFHWSASGSRRPGRQPERALEAYQAAERLAGLLRTPHVNAAPMRAQALQNLVRLGQTDRVEAALAEMDDQERNPAIMRSAIAALRIGGGDPQAATVALAPVIAGSVPPGLHVWLVEAFLLEAIARDMLGDQDSADHALERALDLAEPDRVLHPFLLHPAPGLLGRHARRRSAHTALIADILGLLSGGNGGTGSPPMGKRDLERERPAGLTEPLSPAETRVLRYLPTGLSVAEIAGPAVPVGEHRPHAYAPRLRQDRRAPPPRGRRTGPHPRPARPLLATALRFAAPMRRGAVPVTGTAAPGLGWDTV